MTYMVHKFLPFLKNGMMDIELDSIRGFTALHTSAISNSPYMAQLFLENGADPNSVEKEWGLTPLGLALLSKCEDTCKLLIEHGSDILKIDNNGKSSLFCASKILI